ncbi:MAG: phospholipid carrier-dependent glycosyltransferase [Gammaproteobacteria bacterium]
MAFVLRAWGAGFGLPYELTADEPHQILQALKIGAGEGGPLVRAWHTVGKGGLDYLLFIEYGVLYCVWRLTGRIDSPDDFALAYLTDPSAFYLIGRLTVATLGALTCLAVYGAGRRMYGERIGLIAAIIGAFALEHAIDSHPISVHVPMAFALWCAFWSYTLWEQRPTTRRLIGTAVLAGVAISLAYNAAVGMLVLLLALATAPGGGASLRVRAGRIATFVAAAVAATAMLSSELVLGAGSLLRNFQHVLGGTVPAAPGPRAAIDAVTILREQNWFDYVPILLGPRHLAITLAAGAGIVIGLALRERWTALLTGGTAVLLLLLSASDRGAGERYLLPMVPALWLLAARGVTGICGGRGWAQALLTLAIVVPPAIKIVRADIAFTRTDTRILAKQWIEANVAPGARILVDGMRFRFIQSPPLKPTAEALDRQVAALAASELNYPERFLALYRRARQAVPGPAYDIHSTMYGLEVRELDFYAPACFDYVIVSSDIADRYADEALRRQVPQAARFYDGIRSHPGFRRVYSIRSEPLVRPGPAITVYEVLPACDGRRRSLPTARSG